MRLHTTWVTTGEGVTKVADSERLIRNQEPFFEWAHETFAENKRPVAKAVASASEPSVREGE